MDKEEFVIEQKHLHQTIDDYKEVISDTQLKLKNLPALYPDQERRIAEQERLLHKVNKLENSLKKPYFARIDFYNNESSIKDICYIGKIGVTDYDNKVITVDWRAPISSLYYDSNVGPASYIAPEGKIFGELQLKRQYDIENSILNSFNDVDTVSNDEILKPYLSVSADKRLKNIVASIQSEQNVIIREPIVNNLIIQGVAGSGKTTVALHHIAYLVYNNRDYYDANQYIVIGPNKFFVDYISSVLPDLDVDGVKQFDFVDFASHYLNTNFEIKNSLDNFNVSNSKHPDDNFSYYRTSLEFQKFIKEYMKNFEENMLPKSDLEYKNIKILNFLEIEKEYYSINKKTSDTISKRIDRAILLLSKKIDDRKTDILNKSLKNVLKENNTNKQKENAKDNQSLKKELDASGTNILKRYFKKIKFNIYDIYKNILVEVKSNNKFDCEIDIKLNELKKGIIEFEDLTPLMYIYYIINGAEEFKNYRHVVIDEAQDYNLFTFFMLKKILPNSTFSIYGDLAQSLYSNRSVNSWEDVVEKVFDNNISIKYLNKSYRTTIEIMNEANKINKQLGYSLAEPVIRHGTDVQYINATNTSKSILEQINYMKEKGCKTIVIIGKNMNEVDKMYHDLNSQINIEKITSKNYNFSNNICITTGYLSKGLEFDGVIIYNVTNNNYDINNKLDMKLLYVSMTRALHELCIIYNQDLLKILS